MFKTIVLALDGSDGAKQAIPVAAELSDRGIETKVELAEVTAGGPAHAIVEIADRNDGDLIVTGTRGHGSIAGLVLGSVAHRLLHIAKRPTLAVPS